MSNDALLKEARDIDKTREHWPLVKRLADALTAANVREAALRKEAAEAIEAAYYERSYGKVTWRTSAARRAAQRIGGA